MLRSRVCNTSIVVPTENIENCAVLYVVSYACRVSNSAELGRGWRTNCCCVCVVGLTVRMHECRKQYSRARAHASAHCPLHNAHKELLFLSSFSHEGDYRALLPLRSLGNWNFPCEAVVASLAR